YFRTRRRRRARSSHEQDFTREAAPAVLTVEEADEPEEAPSDADRDRAPRPPRRRTHRVRGTRTPDNRTRAVELTTPAAPVPPPCPSPDQAFPREAAPAALTVEAADEPEAAPSDADRDRAPRPPRRRTHRVRGTRTPDNRTRAVELTMPAAPVLALAKAEGVA